MIVEEEPFMVISNATDRVYKVNKVEVNDKGKVIGYIIQGQSWSPNRFRAKTKVVEEEPKSKDYIVELITDKLYEIKDLVERLED